MVQKPVVEEHIVKQLVEDIAEDNLFFSYYNNITNAINTF